MEFSRRLIKARPFPARLSATLKLVLELLTVLPILITLPSRMIITRKQRICLHLFLSNKTSQRHYQTLQQFMADENWSIGKKNFIRHLLGLLLQRIHNLHSLDGLLANLKTFLVSAFCSQTNKRTKSRSPNRLFCSC